MPEIKLTPTHGFVMGGLTFILASYVLHCKFNMGPWACQKNSKQHCKKAR